MKLSNEIPECIRFWLEKQELEYFRLLMRIKKAQDIKAWRLKKMKSDELISEIVGYYKDIVKVKIAELR